jgi:hypothetical protein
VDWQILSLSQLTGCIEDDNEAIHTSPLISSIAETILTVFVTCDKTEMLSQNLGLHTVYGIEYMQILDIFATLSGQKQFHTAHATDSCQENDEL